MYMQVAIVTMARAAMGAVGLLVLTACSSGLDWRELQWPEGEFAVLLPARPAKETRPVTIDGHALQLTVLPARVEPFLYGVGYADLPSVSDPATRERFLRAARDSLLANLGATAKIERTSRLNEFPCQEFEAEGTIEQRPLSMAARVCITDKRYYQLVAIAPQQRAAEMDATLFLGSLRVLAR